MRLVVITLIALMSSLSVLVVNAQQQVKNEETRATKALELLKIRLNKAVAAGELSRQEADVKYKQAAEGAALSTKGPTGQKTTRLVWELLQRVEKGELTARQAMIKYKSAVENSAPGGKRRKGTRRADLKEARELSKILPKTSTGTRAEGPDSTFIFGWAANATHRFMDNSHLGKPRPIRGISFRLDYRNHNAVGRTWKNVSIRIAHGDFSSIKYNRSAKFQLMDQPVKVFDQQWAFPALKGYPPLKPAPWGGLQNSLTFRFDEPWEYNGRDAIYVEFRFQGGAADDGREWKGELPFGFEYYLDSMPAVGGWRVAVENGFDGAIYTGPARVPAVTSYTAGGQSVWTSAAKGLPFIRWE